MNKITLSAPPDGATVSLLTELQTAFFTNPMRFTPHEPELTPRTVDLSLPARVPLEWRGDSEKAVARIADNPDFHDSLELAPTHSGNGLFTAGARNLFAGKKYFWRVEADGSVSETRAFSTAGKFPRMIEIPFCSNIRDIGLMKAAGGAKIRQGLVYRGSQFGFPKVCESLTPEMSGILIDTLNLRTEIDLRGDGGGSPLPGRRDGIQYFCHGLQAYASWAGTGVFSPEQMKKLSDIFSILADAASYPVYIHCQGGGDRTGTLFFLLEAALGVGEEDMLTDYELSNLSVSGERSRFTETWKGFESKLRTFGRPDDPIGTCAVKFLKECGIAEKTLESIRTALLA